MQGMEDFNPWLRAAFGLPLKLTMVAAVDAAFFLNLPRNIQDINVLKMIGGGFMAQTPEPLLASLRIFGPKKNT